MGSTFGGIEIGKRGLQAHQRSLEVVGHNLSNASTEGYSRQKVQLGTVDPLYNPSMNRELTAGQIGQGVQVDSIKRVRDDLLESRILSQTDDKNYWNTRSDYIQMVEEVYNEIDNGSLRNLMDRFWVSWDELSQNPEDISSRTVVQQHSQALVEGFHSQFERLNDVRKMINDEVQVDVNTLNGHLDDIAELNLQISQQEALGNNPNDLLDRRDLLIEKVATYLPVTVDNRDKDDFSVFVGGLHLVQGGVVSPLSARENANNNSFVDVYFAGGEKVQSTTGKIGALLEARDVDIRKEIQNLDEMSLNLATNVNQIHSKGWTMNNQTGVDFFDTTTFALTVNGSIDTTGDGNLDSTYLSHITGVNKLENEQQPGLQGVITIPGTTGDDTIEVPYFPTDRVTDIIDRINNAGGEVKASLNGQNQLVVQATAAEDVNNEDFVIRRLEDSGLFLTQYTGILQNSGLDGGYNSNQPNSATLLVQNSGITVSPTKNPSSAFRLSDAVKNDVTSIAAGYGDEIRGRFVSGDNTLAMDIGELRYNRVGVGKTSTYEDYFANTLADIGTKGNIAEFSADTFDQIYKDLDDLRTSISGVSIDEEISEMLKFQQGYQASARFLNTYNQMINTIINELI